VFWPVLLLRHVTQRFSKRVGPARQSSCHCTGFRRPDVLATVAGMTRAAPAPPPAGSPVLTPGTSRPVPYLQVIIAALGVVVIVAGLLTYLVIRHRARDSLAAMRPSGIPASVSTPLADLMQLSPVPASTAPGFTLTDQDGHALSLTSFRGRVVVLTFTDPHCTDVCPIVSQEFTDAYRDLGAVASRAVFIAVNVNPYYRGVAAMAAYSAEQHLTTIPSWYYVTGSLATLKAVWSAYDISVDAPSRNADVIHTSEVLFISPGGRERYVATPMADYTARGKAYLPAGPMAEWGQGIALVARQLAR
jgi:cytochrome oxidase Cu insertion factor (SCO1/SenC/PrrC family)